MKRIDALIKKVRRELPRLGLVLANPSADGAWEAHGRITRGVSVVKRFSGERFVSLEALAEHVRPQVNELTLIVNDVPRAGAGEAA